MQTASRHRIDSLTSLRFFAAMMVLVYHFYRLSAVNVPADDAHRPVRQFLLDYAPFLSQSYLMVDFFFILSRFVLSFVSAAAIANRTFSYPSFIRKRFATIYPLHLLTLVAFVLLWQITSHLNVEFGWGELSSWKGAGLHALLLNSVGGEACNAFNMPSWSVSAEWLAYLLFPIMALALLRMSSLRGAAALSLAWFAIVYLLGTTADGMPLTERTVQGGVLRILAEMPLGIVCYRYYAASDRWAGARTWLIGILAALLLAMSLSAPPWIVILLMCGLIFCSACGEREGPIPILGNRWVIYGGEISYAIYMIHTLALVMAFGIRKKLGLSPDSLSSELFLALTAMLVVAASSGVHEYLHTPLKNWLLGRGLRKVSPVPVMGAERLAAAEIIDPGQGVRMGQSQPSTSMGSSLN